MMDVFKGVAASDFVTGRARARVANADHEHFGAHRSESMQVLQVTLEGGHELLLDVEDAAANLANRVMVVTAGKLVVGWAFAQVGGINRP